MLNFSFIALKFASRVENGSDKIKQAYSFNKYLRVPLKADSGKLSPSKLSILLIRTAAPLHILDRQDQHLQY